MAKKQSQYQEMSLFDDSSFWEHPASENSSFEKQGGEKEVKSKAPRQGKQEDESDKVRERSKRQRLRVRFGDGDAICEASATATMIQAIKKLGVERVASLGMEVCHVPLVSREIIPRYAPWTKEIGDGWYLMAQSDTKQKFMQIKSIVSQLDSNAQVEIGNFDQLAFNKNEGKHSESKGKSKLIVTFPDGREICSVDHQQVLAETVRIIGVDKVKKTHLQIGGKPIITLEKRYNNQVCILTGEWLTVPPQVKDKYKILRMLSSITRTPYEVKIVE